MVYTFHSELHPMLWGTENWILPPGEIASGFPLLIKFIDPHLDLSIQVHPTDAYAKTHGLPHGKTEMWVVTDATPTAFLYSGFDSPLTKEQYAAKVADGTIAEALRRYTPKRGDCFYLPPGRIHSLGAGAQVCEIQQNCNITFRIFDYNRRDAQGNLRELHTEKAAECMDFTVLEDYQTHYESKPNEPAQLVQCPYFTTHLLDVQGTVRRELVSGHRVLVCMEGQALLQTGDTKQTIDAQTAVLLTDCGSYVLDGQARILEVTY